METDKSKVKGDFQDKTKNSIKDDLSNYVDKRLELFKLTAFEKLAQSGSFVVYGLIILLLSFNLFLLSLLGLAFSIGGYFDNQGLGFGVLVIITLFILGAFILVGKKFRRYFVNMIIKVLKKIEMNEE